MASGYHDFTAGEVLTAANLEDFCQNQAVMRFADSSARDTALSTVKTEGMVSHQLDSNAHTVYSGSAWSTVGPLYGALTSYTPTLTQSGSVTFTNASSYIRLGRMVIYTFHCTVTGTGTGANAVTITLPFTAASAESTRPLGTGLIFDTSASLVYPGHAVYNSTTTLIFRPSDQAANAALGASVFTAALAAGDTVSGTVMFECAADA